jgi:pyridoxal phosphate enzyme (YggS family)
VDKITQSHDFIRYKYNRVIDQINNAAKACGRNPQAIRLVVVTKTHPVEVVQAVIEAGATDIGENYVEEAIPKIQALASSEQINWHMIGHVQSRKADRVCEYFQYVHSVDSLKLAERLSRILSNSGKSLPTWLEFNIGGEETKSGWNIAQKGNWVNILPDIEKIFSLSGFELLGVMTMPPYSTNPEDSRPFYRQLREFRDYLVHSLHIVGFTEYSMGMSSDFVVAIQEGSTCVRIGQAILGPRPG